MNKPINVDIICEDKKNMPTLGTEGSGAYDVRAAIDTPIRIDGGSVVKVPLGFSVDIKEPNYCGLLMPRSGKGTKGLVLANTVGLIDNDYQGELVAALYNRNPVRSIVVNPGDKVAQLGFIPFVNVNLNSVNTFKKASERGAGGFGHTDEQDTRLQQKVQKSTILDDGESDGTAAKQKPEATGKDDADEDQESDNTQPKEASKPVAKKTTKTKASTAKK